MDDREEVEMGWIGWEMEFREILWWNSRGISKLYTKYRLVHKF